MSHRQPKVLSTMPGDRHDNGAADEARIAGSKKEHRKALAAFLRRVIERALQMWINAARTTFAFQSIRRQFSFWPMRDGNHGAC